MPESNDAQTEGPVTALRRELQAARDLLRAQEELEQALRSGKPGDDVLALVQRQDASARAASLACAARRSYWVGSEGFEAFLQGRPAPEAQALKDMAAQANELRDALRRSARRAEYIARRSVEWSQAQMDLMVRCLTREQDVYRLPGTQRPLRETPSLMDRTA